MEAVTEQVKRWIIDPGESVAVQVPRALVASVLSALLDVAGLFLLVECFGWQPVPAAVVGYLVGGVLQYTLCAVWVFPAAPASVTVGFLSFTLLSLVGLAITWATIAVLHDGCQLHYGAAKVAALALSFGWNFMSRKWFVFRPTETPQASEAVVRS